MNSLYPIGTILYSNNSANPSTYLGGTWIAITGKFIFGRDSSHTTDSGAENVTLDVTMIPSHNHGGATGGYTNRAYVGTWTGGNSGYMTFNSNAMYSNSLNGTAYYIGYSHNHTITAQGGGKAHNNMPPYTPKYIWQRTA